MIFRDQILSYSIHHLFCHKFIFPFLKHRYKITKSRKLSPRGRKYQIIVLLSILSSNDIREKYLSAKYIFYPDGAVLAGVMVILGSVTGVVTEQVKYGTPDSDPAFLAVIFGDMLLFGILAGAGIALRKDVSAHKRLMLAYTISSHAEDFTLCMCQH